MEHSKVHALSLVEVLVVLVIIATTLIAVAQMSVQVLITVKDDEIADYANGILLQAIETAKSPSDVTIDAAVKPITSFTGSYRVISSGTGTVLWKESTTLSPITSCNTSSKYYVDVPTSETAFGRNPIACMQIIVQQKTGQVNQSYYELQATIIYEVNNKQSSNTIIGYRREDFKAKE